MEPLTCSSVSDMALPSERGDLNRHHAASASDCQVVTTETHDYQQVSQSYCGFGIESIWQEFDSRKRSAEYHLNKVRECLHYFKGPDDATTALECQDVVLGQHAVNKDSQYQWHLKVEYDKAARDLIVMENILKILMSNDSSAAEVRSHFASAAMSLTFFTGSCFIASKNYDQIWDIGALTGALYGGYNMAKSSYRGAHGYLRMTALERCDRIVKSFRNRIQNQTIEEEDCASFKSYWFTMLNQFRPENGMDEDDVSGNIRQAHQISYDAVGSRNDAHFYTTE